jgi:hypothetical protein
LAKEQCGVVGIRQEEKVVHVREKSGTAPPDVSEKTLRRAYDGRCRRGLRRWRAAKVVREDLSEFAKIVG